MSRSSPTSSCRRRECGRGKTPSLASGPFDALDALVPARLAEEPELDLVLRAEGAPADIPTPENFWPAPNANRDTKLKAVLGSYDLGLTGGLDEGPEPLTEHVDGGNDLSAVLLARIAIPVTLAAERADRDAAGARPRPARPRRQQPASLHLPARQVARPFPVPTFRSSNPEEPEK